MRVGPKAQEAKTALSLCSMPHRPVIANCNIELMPQHRAPSTRLLWSVLAGSFNGGGDGKVL